MWFKYILGSSLLESSAVYINQKYFVYNLSVDMLHHKIKSVLDLMNVDKLFPSLRELRSQPVSNIIYIWQQCSDKLLRISTIYNILIYHMYCVSNVYHNCELTYLFISMEKKQLWSKLFLRTQAADQITYPNRTKSSILLCMHSICYT